MAGLDRGPLGSGAGCRTRRWGWWGRAPVGRWPGRCGCRRWTGSPRPSWTAHANRVGANGRRARIPPSGWIASTRSSYPGTISAPVRRAGCAPIPSRSAVPGANRPMVSPAWRPSAVPTRWTGLRCSRVLIVHRGRGCRPSRRFRRMGTVGNTASIARSASPIVARFQGARTLQAPLPQPTGTSAVVSPAAPPRPTAVHAGDPAQVPGQPDLTDHHHRGGRRPVEPWPTPSPSPPRVGLQVRQPHPPTVDR